MNLLGTTLDNYEILTEIASGGMAIIYRAYQPALERDVVIKILKPHLAQDPKKRERFVREAKVAAQLRHPNILIIHDAKWDPEREIASIVMEHIPGGTLKDLMGVPMSLELIVLLLEQTCAALHYAHNQGVIHRDIKPSNILLDKDQRVLIADFGLAAIIGGDTQLTGEGEVLGTPDYMAPEQIEGAPVDARTDVYSLGVMVYEMVTGRLPYQAETAVGVMLKRMTETPPSPRTLRPDLLADAEAIILKAMAQTPDDRFPDIQAFWLALKVALQTNKERRRMPLQIDDTLAGDRYKIVKSLGEGAWGIVYLAHDARLQREVALKLLQEKIATDPGEVKHFRREPKITARIGIHPNIVSVYDFIEDEAEGISYIVMEYVDGGNLRKYLGEQKDLQTLDIVRFGLDICHALEAIHEHNIIHLDLKPGNVMLKTRHRRLTAKVSDFGNAIIRHLSSKDNLENPTPTGYPRGTLAYVSPEQLTYKPGDDLDGRADLYSLGAILYEMATGRPLFSLDDPKPVAKRIMEDDPISPAKHNPFISIHVEEVILKALQKKREDRFGSASEMIEALQEVERQAHESMNKFEAHFTDAKLIFERGDWAAALVKFQALPLARNQAQHKEVDQYIQDCRKFVKLDADYQKAKQALSKKEWDGAVDLLREVIRVDPDYRDGLTGQELEQAMIRLEASQEYQKGLAFINRREWQHAFDQLNDTMVRFRKLVNEGDVLEDIADKIAYVRRMRRLEDLFQKVETQTNIALSTMTPESWEEVVQTYHEIMNVAPDPEVYRTRLQEAEQEVTLATYYKHGLSAMEAGNWAAAIPSFQQIKQIDRNYRESIKKLTEAEDYHECQKLRAGVDQDFAREDWQGAKKKLEKISSLLPTYHDAAALLNELETWLAALNDEMQEAWLAAIEKLKDLTHPPFVELKVEKIGYLQQRAELAERYRMGMMHYKVDEWHQARQIFSTIELNYKNVSQLLPELERRAWLDKAARWGARKPRSALILVGLIILMLTIVLTWISRSFIASATPSTVQIGSLEARQGTKMASGSLQTLAEGDQIEITVQARDQAGKFLVHEAIACHWFFIPTPEPANFKTQDECTIKYQMPTDLEKQSVRIQVEGKEGTSIIGASTMSINFALAEE